ncbi:cell division protein SepF [Streptomyces zingiberis]|uniref:Cell division protein SepF n=1 Tax=Streptomyces zingiberis TaxID=2053010 RepID=A0ABX1C0U3_9ACTN|nr:cell division protein SepF [Streptomyces zingiberis]NJQ01209.1 cell division protein SepF [Streptomyces zingiberis]
MNGRHDVTDQQWEGLAEVVPLRGDTDWPTWPGGRPAMPEPEPEPAADTRRFVVLRVQIFADARDVAEHLMSQVPVLLDLTGADQDVAKRILDFSSGVVFGLAAGMHRVDRDVFLLTPAGTEVAEAASAVAAQG